MSRKVRKFTPYKEQKSQRHHILRGLLWFVAVYGVYTILTNVVFTNRVLENNTMLPNLRAGDRLLCAPYTVYRFLPDILNAAPPLRRGNVVTVDLSLREGQTLVDAALDGFLRFFTFQRLRIRGRGEQLYIKRIIGLPGDEITMINYVFRVKPKDSAYSFTEFEMWEKPYDVTIPAQVPALWDGSLPFSGNLGPYIVGEGECFVVSDDRSNTNDSRTWGAIPLDYVVSKAFFRYWPITRLGSP